jgi:histidinol-phosphate aminotransferase
MTVRPRSIVRELSAYSVPRARVGEIDLWLDSNEGAQPRALALDALRTIDPSRIRRYPSKSRVEELIAMRHGVERDRVILCAGGDDAIDRCCRAMLEPGREIILPTPTFEMIERSARIAGGGIVAVEWWKRAFPLEEVLERLSARTAMVALVTPNNPTGAVIPFACIERISRAAREALLLVDLAYIEFADEDITPAVLTLPNAVVIRTFSKSFGCAGLRAGYALGAAESIGWLRAVGGPYPTSGPSLEVLETLLERGERDDAYFAQVRRERTALEQLASDLGMVAHGTHANFVLVDMNDSMGFRDAMAARGIAVRAFSGHPILGGSVRITCPGRSVDFDRLCKAMRDSCREIST